MPTSVTVDGENVLELMMEIERLEAEYKALWDAVIAFMNAPGNIESQAVEAYTGLVRAAMASRFWNEASNEGES